MTNGVMQAKQDAQKTMKRQAVSQYRLRNQQGGGGAGEVIRYKSNNNNKAKRKR